MGAGFRTYHQRMILQLFQSIGEEGFEENRDGVAPRAQEGFDIPLPGSEHVVGAGDFLAIDRHDRESVESLADETDMPACKQVLRYVELAAVQPVLVLDPFQPMDIVRPVPVRDFAGGSQIEMHAAGHSGRDFILLIRTADRPFIAVEDD